MNIQIMQYADFSLDEIRGGFGFHKMENSDTTYCDEVAAFLDAKNAKRARRLTSWKRSVGC
ncbi:hypothetical protein [Cytobacillus citreus]|uniref:hypothetical protein n=1 Tax=Cytobacillus citreus TaxID=2833586 RepID=UPI002016EE94|nr:hypothetical protein [Cytobacillus citreus]